MSAVPVILNGVMYPKGRGADDVPIPAVFCGYLSIEGLSIGGGPIVPPDVPPIDPPPIDPPIDPPPGAGVVVVIKPAPVTGGWGLASDASGALQWFYVPGDAGPKGP
jgi:hypothetical protein